MRIRGKRDWRQSATLLKGLATAWLEPRNRERRRAEAAVVREHGLSPGVVRYSFNLWLQRLASGELVELWEGELGHADSDCVNTLFGVFAGTLPEPTIQSVCHALLMRTFMLGRVSSREWEAAVCWIRDLARMDPELAELIVLASWPADREEWTRAACAHAEGTMVFGGDATVEKLRAWTPADRRFVARGHRVSLTVIDAGFSPDDLQDLAWKTSLDMVIHDQTGCLSPQYVIMEDPEGQEARRFAGFLAESLRVRAAEWSAPVLSEAEIVKWRVAMNRARAEAAMGGGGCFFAAPSSAGRYGVVLHRSLDRLPGNPLHRFMHVIAVSDGREAGRLIHPLKGRIAAVAQAGKNVEFGGWLGEGDASWLSAVRFCSPGEMQDPPLAWMDGGIPNLRIWTRPRTADGHGV